MKIMKNKYLKQLMEKKRAVEMKGFYTACSTKELEIHINSFKENSHIKELEDAKNILNVILTFCLAVLASAVTIWQTTYQEANNINHFANNAVLISVVISIIIIIFQLLLIKKISKLRSFDDQKNNIMKKELHKKMQI